jgi:hypothetical protein
MSDLNLQVDSLAFAYLQQATIEIISEQGYQPFSVEDFNAWLEENHMAIAKRASDLNQEFYLKFIRNKVLILSILGTNVYYKIHLQLLLEKEARCIVGEAFPWGNRIFKDESVRRFCD